jgi:hypothetical protein
MRQDQTRSGDKRLLCSLDLEIKDLFWDEGSLLQSIRHSRTSWQVSFVRRIQHYLDSGYSPVISIAGLGLSQSGSESPLRRKEEKARELGSLSFW